MTVRTRFAPSPTGTLHLGSIRTALFCWLYAHHFGGKFVLRIEDTDRTRSTPENVAAILEGMAWLGLDADEGPIFQTDRFDRYREVAEQLLSGGRAYHCYCSREELAAERERQMSEGLPVRYSGRCRDKPATVAGVDPVVRFKNPRSGRVTVDDVVRGTVTFENEQLDDLIILRSDKTPTYNFTVVVDDNDMRITHVIRGDDHLNNTPRQINIFDALGAAPPVFAHLPMILGDDGAKLSKRHGAVDIRDYRAQGYLPDAMLNYLVRLGWSHGNQEVFSRDEMVRLFDLVDVNQSASAFNPQKLRWLNQQHIIASPAASLGEMLSPFLAERGLDPRNGPDPADVAEGFRTRAETLAEMAEMARFCYEDFGEVDAAAARKNLRPVVLEPLRTVRERMASLDSWRAADIAAVIERTAAEFGLGLGKLGQPLRVAVTGKSVSPPIDVTLHLAGRERTLERVDRAIVMIADRSASSQ